mmetsp:Transcript_87893/g.253534  ORF Transcript_87893/g.253534 Transcript_87893/m.253534 type:complete len:294 (-) Transcript_87893:125-1006(-)
MQRSECRGVDGEGLHPMVLRAVNGGLAHIGDHDHLHRRLPRRRLRHTEPTLVRPPHGAGADRVVDMGPRRRQANHRCAVEPRRVGPTVRAGRGPTHVPLRVRASICGRAVGVAPRLRPPSHRRGLVAQGRRPAHLHGRGAASGTRKAQVLRPLRVGESHGVGDGDLDRERGAVREQHELNFGEVHGLQEEAHLPRRRGHGLPLDGARSQPGRVRCLPDLRPYGRTIGALGEHPNPQRHCLLLAHAVLRTQELDAPPPQFLLGHIAERHRDPGPRLGLGRRGRELRAPGGGVCP